MSQHCRTRASQPQVGEQYPFVFSRAKRCLLMRGSHHHSDTKKLTMSSGEDTNESDQRPPPVITPSEKTGGNSVDLTTNRPNPGVPLPFGAIDLTGAASFARLPFMQSAMYSSLSPLMPQCGYNSFQMEQSPSYVESVDVGKFQPTKKTKKISSDSGKRYHQTQRDALIDIVAKVRPSECKRGWEKVKKEYEKQTGNKRTAKALQSQYETLSKAKDNDPELGRFAKKIRNSVDQDFINNSVLTTVPGFPGNLYEKSEKLDGSALNNNNDSADDDDDDNKKESTTEDADANEKAAKLKRKKREQQLEELKKKRDEEKAKKDKEDALLQAAAVAMTNFQGGEGMNEKVTKIEIKVEKQEKNLKKIDDKLDMILKKLA